MFRERLDRSMSQSAGIADRADAFAHRPRTRALSRAAPRNLRGLPPVGGAVRPDRGGRTRTPFRGIADALQAAVERQAAGLLAALRGDPGSGPGRGGHGGEATPGPRAPDRSLGQPARHVADGRVLGGECGGARLDLLSGVPGFAAGARPAPHGGPPGPSGPSGACGARGAARCRRDRPDARVAGRRGVVERKSRRGPFPGRGVSRHRGARCGARDGRTGAAGRGRRPRARSAPYRPRPARGRPGPRCRSERRSGSSRRSAGRRAAADRSPERLLRRAGRRAGGVAVQSFGVSGRRRRVRVARGERLPWIQGVRGGAARPIRSRRTSRPAAESKEPRAALPAGAAVRTGRASAAAGAAEPAWQDRTARPPQAAVGAQGSVEASGKARTAGAAGAAGCAEAAGAAQTLQASEGRETSGRPEYAKGAQGAQGAGPIGKQLSARFRKSREGRGCVSAPGAPSRMAGSGASGPSRP